jgi:hypothetical protein
LNEEIGRNIGFSPGLWPWKYLREGGAINQWNISKWKPKTSTTLHANRRERDDTNVTNDDIFRSVCTAYSRPIFVVCADMTHSPWENPTRIPIECFLEESESWSDNIWLKRSLVQRKHLKSWKRIKKMWEEMWKVLLEEILLQVPNS